MRRALIVALPLLLEACGATTPCASRCPSGTLCEASGVCTPIDDARAEMRSASAFLEIEALDWATTRSDRLAERDRGTDVLEIGGSPRARALLEFAPLPPEGRVASAEISLTPQASAGPPEDALIVLHAALPFSGRNVTSRRAAIASGPPLAETVYPRGATSRLRFDVTEALKRAIEGGSGAFRVMVRVADGDGAEPLRVVSPRGTSRRERPRLQVTLE